MIKKIFLLLNALLSVLSVYSQNAAADEFIRLGYCKDNFVSVAGPNNEEGHCGVATYFPESTMRLYEENQITSLKFSVGIKNAKNFKLFITSDLNKEEYDYVQEVTKYTSNRWNEIVLDKPYDIDGKAIYIGFELVQQGYVLQFTEAYESGNQYVWLNDKWELNNSSYAAAIYGVVKGDHLPRYNVGLMSTRMTRYTDTKKEIVCSGVFRNKALETVHSLTLSYFFNGKESGNVTIAGMDIAYREEGNFEVELSKLPEGKTDVTCSVTAINDHYTDIDMTDNVSKVHAVSCSDHFVQRTALLEVFSTEQCPNCPDGHAILKEFVEGNKDVIEIVHHSAFYTDPFTIDASLEYEWFFGKKQHSAPTFMLDRTRFHEELPELYSLYTPVTDISRFDKALETALNVPAFASVNLTLDAKDNSRKLTIRVDGEELYTTNDDNNHRLFVYITEDNVEPIAQSGAYPGYLHTALLRQCVTDAWGDTITLRQGYEKEYHIEIPYAWKIENLHVIATVGHVDKNDVTNCRIYNATTKEVKSVTTGLTSEIAKEKIRLTLSGKTLILTGDCKNIGVYTLDGICQVTGKDCHSLSLNELSKGTYIVRVQNENAVSVYKIQLDE